MMHQRATQVNTSLNDPLAAFEQKVPRAAYQSVKSNLGGIT